MKNLLALMLSIFALTASASHHSEYVDTRDDGTTTRISVVHDDDEHYATYEKNGVRYITRDLRVLEELETELERSSGYGREEARLGREEARLGREEAAIGREEAQLARSGDDSEEARRRIEEKRRGIEEKRRDVERERRAVEEKRSTERGESLASIFERAVRDGRAERRQR
ncbi:MAG: hypothetical protein DMF56_17565 [Acidobacteria bacterium]|nr:MAG: hypothetical protein DMF56_17565 [Acidobacteriota bacterium]